MQVSVEAKEGLERQMTVELPADQVNEAVEKRLKEVARTVKLDGFRPGKVPMSVVRKRFAGQVRQEVFGDLVQSSYYQALAQEKLMPAGEPSSVEPVEKDPAEGMAYTATFEVMPEVALVDISDRKLVKPVAEVTDEDLEEMILKLRKQRTTWTEVDREAADGDQVMINFKGFIDGEAFEGGSADEAPLVLGSGAMIEGFEAGLVGARADEERTLEVKFPEDYRAENLAGKSATFEVKVVKVLEPTLPELDEEFAKAFGIAEGGTEALLKDIRDNMGRELADKISGLVKERAMDLLLETHQLEVPQVLVRQESEALREQTKRNFQQYGQSSDINLPLELFEGQAKKRVALGLLISEIIKANEIKVDAERVRAKVESFAQAYEDPQEVIDYYYGNKDQLAGIENVVLEDQVVDWIVDQVQVEEASTGFDEVMNPKPEAAAEEAEAEKEAE